MNDADRRLAAIAAIQRQVFTREQALVAGLSVSAIERRERTGFFVAHGSQTRRFVGSSLDWRGALLAGLLDLGDGSLVTGRAAAAIHGLDGFPEGPLEFLVPTGHRHRKTVGRVISTPVVGPLDRATVDGLRVTSGTRTVLELIGRVSERELGNALDSALRRGLTSPGMLLRRLDELGRRGRRGVAVFDRVMQSAGVQSWLERQFLHLVEGAGLPRPGLQRIFRHDGRHIARVDFDFEPWPVLVEVGGRRGYLSADERRRQERRRNELQLLGKVVYFFTTEDVTDDPAYVIATIRQALLHAAA